MKILIIKPSSLGDIIHSMAFLKALKELYPKAHISWVVSNNLKDLLEGHPLIDHLFIFNKDQWRKFNRIHNTIFEIPEFIKTIRIDSFHMVVDLQGLLRSGLITFFAKSPLKIGFDAAREGSKYFYNKRIQTKSSAHAVDRYLEVVQFLKTLSSVGNCEKGFQKKIQFPLPIDNGALKAIKEKLPGKKEYVVVAPSARWPSKRWLPESFGKVIANLPIESVIVGSRSDSAIAKDVLIAAAHRGIDLCGKTNLKELVALIAGAKLLISNDSGPIHIATSLGIPLIALFGPTDPNKTGPYGWDFPNSKNHVLKAKLHCSPCLKRDCRGMDCLKSIQAENVIEVANQYL